MQGSIDHVTPLRARIAKRFRKNSRSFRDYEAGKRLLADLPPGEYEDAIHELAKYLGI